MPKLVNMPSKQSRLRWDEIKANGFDKTLFKIHLTAVYEGYIRALKRVFDPNDKEGIISAGLTSPPIPPPVTQAVIKRQILVPTKQRITAHLAPRSHGMERFRHLKLLKVPSNPGSYNMMWITSSNTHL